MSGVIGRFAVAIEGLALRSGPGPLDVPRG